jgi:hypothetical protein
MEIYTRYQSIGKNYGYNDKFGSRNDGDDETGAA